MARTVLAETPRLAHAVVGGAPSGRQIGSVFAVTALRAVSRSRDIGSQIAPRQVVREPCKELSLGLGELSVGGIAIGGCTLLDLDDHLPIVELNRPLSEGVEKADAHVQPIRERLSVRA